MATSGTYVFTMTISEFLDRVLMLSGIVGEGEVANASQTATALDSLNLMQQQLEVNDIPLWKRDFYDFVPSVSSYVTNGGVQYRCLKGHTSTADSEPGTGSMSELYWKSDDDDNATPSAWALSQDYTSSIEFTVPAKFYDILFATTLETSGNETALDIISFDSYNQGLNSKRTTTTSTSPTTISFDNKSPTNTGFIFPQPTASFSDTIRLFGILKPEDSVNVGDNIDIPARYLNMLSYNVALDLAMMYQVDTETIQLLTRQADYFLKQYKRGNKEFTKVQIATGAY